MHEHLQQLAEKISKKHGGSKILTESILVALQDVLEGARADVPQRLARYLLAAFDAHHGSGEITLPQDQIAEEIGATRSYVSTLLTAWKGEGVIRAVGRKMFLEDRDALARKAEIGNTP